MTHPWFLFQPEINSRLSAGSRRRSARGQVFFLPAPGRLVGGGDGQRLMLTVDLQVEGG